MVMENQEMVMENQEMVMENQDMVMENQEMAMGNQEMAMEKYFVKSVGTLLMQLPFFNVHVSVSV